ncbi:c-type cytochrome [Neomegalonema perideroedes]|uniref:c-type cytochrome n=1 Tax=Neomegalonema perideroedes TaxID=217219 RepID=UPI00037EC2F4|nr:cytochrome c [Neomegalonema perideroedes]
MTLSRLIPLGTAAALSAFFALSPLAAQEAAETPALAPAEALKARVAAMKAIGGANRALAPLAAGQTVPAAALQAAAKTMSEEGAKLAAFFPAGSSISDLPESYALPTIWSDSEGFSAALEKFQKAAHGLEQAAEGGDQAAISAAFAELRPTCGACHQTYRQPKN